MTVPSPTAWWEVIIECAPPLEEMVFWRLQELDCRSTATTYGPDGVRVTAYAPQTQYHPQHWEALQGLLQEDAREVSQPPPQVRWQLMDSQDWSAHWKRHWQPQPVGERLLIQPAWLPVHNPENRLVLRLDPGFAFGTGSHPTTRLCLEALEMRLDKRWGSTDLVIADIGCGSGILAIGAVLLGAKQVYAVDIDPLAIATTRQNQALNQIKGEQLVVEQGSLARLAELLSQPLDGFVCNISAETLIAMAPHWRMVSHAKTWGLLSGFIGEQLDAVTKAVSDQGWMVAAVRQSQEWCCLHIRPDPDYTGGITPVVQ
ncbi:MAG: 50S ribosomal protein L11 methyltransferase [Gloeomargarita sp. SKYBB_i_bin120]|nr:50S ribosomal protein L11 methyltransferase [Gloeomargarita sp. SKYG98]MCS7291551.1 50S ribosomal protein L11 methyltransferase [Gloeomargarita sp. SKYB120]MDW8177111.1 50S ribosomal protein L11 methyltransferase [Gloeomargarita sp. SKYBB_i_bin120]